MMRKINFIGMGYLKSIVRTHLLGMALDAFFAKLSNNLFRFGVGSAGLLYGGRILAGQSFSKIKWVGESDILGYGHEWHNCFITRVSDGFVYYDSGHGESNWEQTEDLEFYL